MVRPRGSFLGRPALLESPSGEDAPLCRPSSIVVDERPAVDHRRACRQTWSVPPSGVEQLAV